MFPVGLLIMLTDLARQFTWTTTIFLGIQSFNLLIIAVNAARFTKAMILALSILLLSFLIEFIGVTTGIPFGAYSYTEVLAPIIAGVPAAIIFAWFSVAVSTYFTTVSLYGKAGVLAASFISSVLILATDILLEPFASFINGFWLWNGGIIPFQNYISWLVFGFLICLLISLFVKPDSIRQLNSSMQKMAYIIVSVNILTFLIVNLFYEYIISSAVAIIIVVVLTLILPGSVKHEA